MRSGLAVVGPTSSSLESLYGQPARIRQMSEDPHYGESDRVRAQSMASDLETISVFPVFLSGCGPRSRPSTIIVLHVVELRSWMRSSCGRTRTSSLPRTMPRTRPPPYRPPPRRSANSPSSSNCDATRRVDALRRRRPRRRGHGRLAGAAIPRPTGRGLTRACSNATDMRERLGCDGLVPAIAAGRSRGLLDRP